MENFTFCIIAMVVYLVALAVGNRRKSVEE